MANFTPALFLRLTIALLGMLFVHSASADMQIIEIERGVFSRPDLKLEAGERLLVGGSKELVEPVRQVPAKLGVKFGVRFKVTGKSATTPNVLSMLYLTPGIIEKDGSRHDRYSITKDLNAGAASHDMAFQITETYEQVPGVWEFLIFDGDRLLLREKFELVP